MNKDQNHIDNLFDKARNQQPITSFEETSGQFLNDLGAGKTSSLTQGVAKSFNFKYLIMLSTISVIVVSAVIYFNSNEPAESEVAIVPIEKEIIEDLVEAPLELNEEIIIVETVTIEKEKVNIVTSTYNAQVSDSMIVSTREFEEVVNYDFLIEREALVNKQKDPEYRFPKLTADQIASTKKQKKQMLKQLNKLDKKKYAYIPSGSFDHNGKAISVQAFYMQTTEVTVLEYRTFIFDLLIQDRKEEFLKAKPDQEQWKFIMGNQQSSMQPMVDNYFSHSAYNQYPINNISREGAELYCRWLTTEATKVRKGKKEALNDIRLPSDCEWMFAAKGGEDNQESFPWKTSSVRNKKNCYLANFKPVRDSVYSEEKGKFIKCESRNFFMDDGAFLTAKVDSYLPNEYGLYCMAGNAAEMVVNWKDKSPGTKGGSWISDLPELMITGEDKNSGVTEAKAHIGFRVVVTHIKQLD